MNKILEKEVFSPDVKMYVVEAPEIARRCQPGQFVIIRIDEEGERIPLTIADFDREKGNIILVVQEVGKSSRQLGTLDSGDVIADVCGPLGNPTHLDGFSNVIIVGGGIGIAPIYPIAKAFYDRGARVTSIIGARSKDLLIFEDRMRAVSNDLIVTTDDGTYGRKALVTEPLKELLEADDKYDLCVAIGPAVMMKFVSLTTKPFNLKTVVSLNSIMIDGTGMCGGCRVDVGGKVRFTCVDGPEFDGHQVDFNLLLQRQDVYQSEEREADKCWLDERMKEQATNK